MTAFDADVVIVGGGPVGLVTAIEARLAGLDALVLERHPGVVDKACGEGLMPGALPLLARLGVDPEGMPLRGVSYRSASGAADHRFAGPAGRGVRRTVLHAALRARALAAGARVERMRVTELATDADGVTVGGIRSRWLVGADGLHSTVRRLAGLAGRAGGVHRFGYVRHYALAPWTDLVEVHWSPRVEIYVTPVAPGLVGFAMLGPRRIAFDEALAELPELCARVTGAEHASSLAGAGPLRQRAVAPSRGRVLLVGDASGYVDAITGEGLRLGFAQARAAIASLTGGPAYAPEWRRITRGFRVTASVLVGAAGTPLRRAIVPAARRLPRLYGAIVEQLAR
ncbi:FAD-dependent monooxygenase [Galbitalea sp. SE-J8]|uniref:NAD(P)/FAD-dependent oxidoreductase n=1 Tax=Galbitalea sp. SE-J8 TaxID=3054952 RepID=UPI00259CC504|nr:FAD-dependent monooxygenase [Galbitalea sp. SE-J8]MDM4763301.1 FAD-dependent monooxygenase [Galbitalea sp. SE-J8]